MRVFRIGALLFTAQAWDTDGHSAIGMTIMSGIKGPALTQLKRLLGGKDVVDVAPWAPAVVKKYPTLERMFNMMQDVDADNEIANCTRFDPTYPCPDHQCLVAATKHFYGRLAANESDATTVFNLPVNLKLTDADNMKFLVALLGELHNPVRYGYTVNDGGRAVPITYIDNGHTKESTLFQYWDSDLVQKTIRDRPNFWFSGWTHLNSLGRGFYEDQQNQWKNADYKERLAIIEKWAAETFQASCTRVQRKFAQSVDEAKNEKDLLVPAKHNFTPSAMFLDFEYVKAKLLTAGIRASIVLNSILDSRDAKKLRVGSGVHIQMEQNHALNPLVPNKVATSGLTQWGTNFAINLVIILTVLTAFGLFIKYSSGGGFRRTPTVELSKAKEHE
eukprot:Blabericola_migrator_1__9387@NODE_506_length_7963_cov_38_720618_g388_i0_p4_GENE_NODE_506_length_7963_cov_38_720618_g388_i0NODE_506_length_7963_cov_38_720618_g388_i0_p4_ORF_typecomplete_len397_score64_17S1P1_nuclease/PF02265_16/7_9e31_NODE_506_length_7963_cov_38_720618_g388_i067727938